MAERTARTRPRPKLTRFDGLKPASEVASRTARASSRKRDTKCEQALRRALWKRGLRYRVDACDLPGRPDIAFVRARVVVFCDGDFWHGRDLKERIRKLARGNNAPYWIAKIQTNVSRDRWHDEALATLGWVVLRFWEGDILHDTARIADVVAEVVARRRNA